MAVVAGTVVGGAIVPTDSADTYPVTDPQWGLGGWRASATTTTRNAIPVPRLQKGMVVHVLADGVDYQLKDTWGGAALSVNADWEVFAGGGAGGTWTPQGVTTTGAVGGIPAAANLGIMPINIEDTLLDIFYPYRGPGVTLSTLPAGGVREIGTSIASVDLTATTVRYTDPITTVEYFRGVTMINAEATPIAAGGIETYTDGVAVSTATTYTAQVGDGTSVTTSNAVTFTFLPGIYYGVANTVLTTGAAIITNFGASVVLTSSRLVSYIFDASVGGGANYLYIAYPTSFGLPASTLFNGFTFTDYTVSTVSLTNASGHTQNYYILRTNNTYNAAAVTWQIL